MITFLKTQCLVFVSLVALLSLPGFTSTSGPQRSHFECLTIENFHQPAIHVTADTNLVRPGVRTNRYSVDKTLATATYTISGTTLFSLPQGAIPAYADYCNIQVHGPDILYNRSGANINISPIRDMRMSEQSTPLQLNTADFGLFRAKSVDAAGSTITVEYRGFTY